MFRKSGCHDPRPTTKSAFVKFSFHGIVSMNIDKSNFTVLPCIGYLLQQYSKILKCRIRTIQHVQNDHKYLIILGLQIDLCTLICVHNQVDMRIEFSPALSSTLMACAANALVKLHLNFGLLSRSRLSAPT